MKFKNTKLAGVYIVQFEPKTDKRGYFERIFCMKEFHDAGIPFSIVQMSRSFTREKGIIRGMHFQATSHEEDKLVQCTKGSVYDVVVDLRKESPSYGQWIAETLTEDSQTGLFIQKGCAHGFQTMEPNTELLYAMSEYYSPEHASGVRCTDPFFHITWPLPIHIGSPKDKRWPLIAI